MVDKIAAAAGGGRGRHRPARAALAALTLAVRLSPRPAARAATGADLATAQREVERGDLARARPEHPDATRRWTGSSALRRRCSATRSGRTPSIHITGTNGKTSTARMIDALLRGLGLRTGRFTSPHLVSIRERIVVDGAAGLGRAVRRGLRRDRSRTSGWSTSVSPAATVVLRGAHRRWPSRPSPTRRSTWRWSRSAWAAGWDCHQRRGRRGRGDHPDRARPHRAGSATRSRRSRRRRPASSSRARRPCWPSSRWPPPRCCCGTRSRWARRWPAKAWSSAC